MKKTEHISKAFFSLILIVMWSAILFVTHILYIMSDMFRLLGNGILVHLFIFIYALTFILPIIFRKRISKYMPLSLSFIVFTVISVMLAGFLIVGAKSYISDFSTEKWNDNKSLRVYMLDSLEKEHGVIGKTDTEITALLGEPTYTSTSPDTVYEYYVGDSMIDPYGYQITFENGVAASTKLVEH